MLLKNTRWNRNNVRLFFQYTAGYNYRSCCELAICVQSSNKIRVYPPYYTKIII